MEQFGLDDYSYNLLIDYFKSKPKIKIVRIFGSRSRGQSKKCADLDFFVEGPISDDEIYQYKKEIENLRHPYCIDLVSLNTEIPSGIHFIKCSFKYSKYFYRRSDYFSDESYNEMNTTSTEEIDSSIRWKYCFERSFVRVLNDFKTDYGVMKNQLKMGIYDIHTQIAMFTEFKKVFEGIWKTLKYYLKENKLAYESMPRNVFKAAEKFGVIDNYKIWSDMIYDFNIMTDEPFINTKDELIYRLENIYLPEIEKLFEYLSEKYEQGIQNEISTFKNGMLIELEDMNY